MTPTPAEGPVTISDIVDLLAWARRLTDTTTTVDESEETAYLAAKADLLARIPNTHAHHHRPRDTA